MFQQYEFVFCVLSSERNRSDIGFATEALPLVSKVKHNSGIGNARYPAASNESSVCVNPVHGSTTRVHCDIHSYTLYTVIYVSLVAANFNHSSQRLKIELLRSLSEFSGAGLLFYNSGRWWVDG